MDYDARVEADPDIRFYPGERRPFICPAQIYPMRKNREIETLIKQVADLKDAKFVRNGSAYNADSAVFLRRKWKPTSPK